MKKFKTLVNYLTTRYEYRIPQKQVICDLDFYIDLNKVPCIDSLWNDKRFQCMLNDGKLQEYNVGYPDFVLHVCGYADCKDTDKFDKEKGRKIALTRAQKNAFLYARDFYSYCGYLINEQLKRLDTLCYNSNISVDRCKNHISNKLLK